MRQEYKNTFDKIHVSDELEEKLLNIPQDTSTDNSQKRYISRRFAYVALIAILFFIPTISVLAANGFDVGAVFGRFFGDKVALVEDNATLPEVNVLSNTFENIDIVPTGIVGDMNLVFITMDVIKKDGSNFNEEELFKTEEEEGILNSEIMLKKAKDILNWDDNTNNKDLSASDVEQTDLDNIEYNSTYTMGFLPISSDDVEGNKLSLVFFVGVKTEFDGKVYDVPGETYCLRFSNDNTKDDFGSGVWEGEITINYKEADSIKLDVNKLAQMPEWGKDNEYLEETDMMIKSIELSPFKLKYVCEYKNNKDDLMNGEIYYWDQIYIVMDDGSIVGDRNTFENYVNRLKGDRENTKNIWFDISGSSINGEDWEYDAIFNKPIDIKKVKEIHIGNLTIDVK